MTKDEDRRIAPRGRPGGERTGAEQTAGGARRTRRRLRAAGLEERFRAKHFVLGLSYGFALGFILEAILASHP